MYDITDGGAILRRYISVNLGWWHTLKNVVDKVWQRFAPSVFAPFFYSLYPVSRFPVHSRGPQDGLIHILYLAAAYRQRIPGTKTSIRSKLKELKERASAPYSSTDQQAVFHLFNLFFLFEYAIPSVSISPSFAHLLNRHEN